MGKTTEKKGGKEAKRLNPGWVYSLKTQGKIKLVPGFSFDSDAKVKLYEVNA